MTPKLRSTSVIPIVSQIWSQSARSCSLLNRIVRGAAVVPEVNLRSNGALSSQCIVAAAVLSGRTLISLPPETAAATTAHAPQISSAAFFCCSLIVCSSGKTTNCLRKHASRIDGQSAWLPIWTAMTLPAPNVSIFSSKSRASSSICANARIISPSVLKIAGESFARVSVFSHAVSSASFDFIACVDSSARVSSALVFENESGHSSRVLRDRYRLRVWRGLSHALHSP